MDRKGLPGKADEQYDRLRVKSRQPRSIAQFFRESPFVGVVSRNASDFTNAQVQALNPWEA